MTQVAAVVVTHNSEEDIEGCLESLESAVDEIVVVDNASVDRTRALVEKAGKARLIANDYNRGFGGGANQGIAATRAPLVVLANPDVRLMRGLGHLVSAFEQEDVGAACGMMVTPDDRPQIGFVLRRFPSPWVLALEALGINRLWPRNPVNVRYRCLDVELGTAQEVEQPPGAFLMVRKAAWESVGGFDEGYWPIWFEDVDFLQRLRRSGYRIVYRPETIAVHRGGGTIEKLPWGVRQLYWYQNMLRYSTIHFGPAGKLLVGLGILIGATARIIPAAGKRGSEAFGIYGKVIWSTCLRMLHTRAEGGGVQRNLEASARCRNAGG